jgi:hypothetical protein
MYLVNDCGWAFALKKDLDRHRKTKHPEMVERFVALYCPFERCKYSEGTGRGFSRADNLNRHVNTVHVRNGDDSKVELATADSAKGNKEKGSQAVAVAESSTHAIDGQAPRVS